MLNRLQIFPYHFAKASAVGLWLMVSGCSLSHEQRIEVIRREAADAETRAEEMLATAQEACAGDPDCLRATVDEYARRTREIQAMQDARIDAELERARRR